MFAVVPSDNRHKPASSPKKHVGVNADTAYLWALHCFTPIAGGLSPSWRIPRNAQSVDGSLRGPFWLRSHVTAVTLLSLSSPYDRLRHRAKLRNRFQDLPAHTIHPLCSLASAVEKIQRKPHGQQTRPRVAVEIKRSHLRPVFRISASSVAHLSFE